MIRYLLPLVLAWLLAGCASGLRSNAPPTQIYVLRSLSVPARAQPVPATLKILRPVVQPGLDTDRIALLAGQRLDYYAGSRWSDHLPQVLEAALVQTLRGSGAIASVQDERAPFGGDYVLRVVVRRFEADYGPDANAAPQVRVSFDCTLGRRSERSIVANFVAEAAAQAGENRMSAVAGAFEQALHAALAMTVDKTVAALATEPQSR